MEGDGVAILKDGSVLDFRAANIPISQETVETAPLLPALLPLFPDAAS